MIPAPLKSLVVTIPGPLRGQERAGRSGRRSFTPEATAIARNAIVARFIETAGRPVLAGPLALRLDITVEPPASWSDKRRMAALGQPAPGKPDWDNQGKLVCDALNRIAWADDSQITDAHVVRRYGASASTRLEITPLGAGTP